MAAYDASRLGQVNQASTETAIFLEVFSGMVVNAFDTVQVTDSKVTKRPITSGKSAQFPLTWKTTADYHTAGAELVGDEISHAKRNIDIENLLVASVFVDVLDEAMNHYSVRAEYAHQLGQALANIYDKNNFRSIYKGSLGTHPITLAQSAGVHGYTVDTAAMSTSATPLKAGIYQAAQYFDEMDVPESGRTIAVPPYAFYLLLEDATFIDRDYAGEGSLARAKIPYASDLEVVKSNNIPMDDETTPPAGVPTTLSAVDFGQNVAAVWHPGGVGVVELMGLATETEYSARHQGSLLLAKRALGQNYVRTECCISLRDNTL
jgi:hypothetical protein